VHHSKYYVAEFHPAPQESQGLSWWNERRMLPEKPWKLEAVAFLFLGVMSTFCLGMLVAGLLNPSTPGSTEASVDFWQIVLGASFLQIPALAGMGLFFWLHKVSWKEAFGLQMTTSVKAVMCGLFAAALFLPVAWCYQSISIFLMDLARMNPQSQVAVRELQDPTLTAANITVLAVIYIVMAPLVEEALFRGILYPAIKQSGHPRWALWGSSLFFATVHFNMPTFVPLLFLALLLVYLYETFQNLLAPIAAHALFNAVNFIGVIFADQLDRLLHPIVRILHLT
jgi:membrane protease YdiL (CAAX protease family)